MNNKNTHTSPWLYQLEQFESKRKSERLERDHETDIAIAGAGIAGVSTAYFLLTKTNFKVSILEAYKVAHGATGHNAGQVTSYFERSFASIAEEFGLPMAVAGQKMIEDAWLILEEMYQTAQLQMPYARFTGYAGLSSFEQVKHHMHENELRVQGGLQAEQMYIDESAPFVSEMQVNHPEWEPLYTLVSKEKILSMLESKDEIYVAMLSHQKGCINSALFSEHVLAYLARTYPDRLSIFEQTPVDKIVIGDTSVAISCGLHEVKADKIILCTNGFEGFRILYAGSLAVDTNFHRSIRGVIGYMAGYVEGGSKPPIAVSYFFDPDSRNVDPYFYMTRRPFDDVRQLEAADQGASATPKNLVCIGGPESELNEKKEYAGTLEYPLDAEDAVGDFIKRTYKVDEPRYTFQWHGLMGYTENGLRMVGPDIRTDRLLYNLGCNGVGILPSLAGAHRIADILLQLPVEPSIFDPRQSPSAPQ